MSKKSLPMLWVALITLSGAPMPASGVDSEPTPTVSADHAAGRRAVEAKDWAAAIRSLTAAARREDGNPDVHNLLGFAYRNSGQVELALKHYQRALQLDDQHLGAHEYIGEAYLMQRNLAMAEQHLATLTRICPRSCEQRDDLKRKIDAYRARNR